MKPLKTVLITCLFFVISINAFCQKGKSDKPKKVKAGSEIDSSAVKIYLEYICTVEKDGTVKNNKGEILGKMYAEGTIKDAEGKIIGRREKTKKEISAELIRNTY
jgi:hypothetical protein